MNAFFDAFETPVGAFSVATDATGAVLATALGDVDALRGRLDDFHVLREKRIAPDVREQVAAYFAGERKDFDLPLAAAGTPFQRRVWTALQQIPFGVTRSYGDLARELRSSPRAIGRANATNPICLIVPCHRVIGADGSLTGFAFGEKIKQRLLDHERSAAAAARAA
ncbi:MAG TPA: methylated-DNA--[protein]-cysteine S-methyltransferase [Opitutaceae bacterium]|nr:methylated-DNA--[protein]-cysteine S-methyltransferase [Opitutaceae bacterium]